MYLGIGITLITFTIALGFVFDRQRFNRRNRVGIEEFASQGQTMKIKFEEGAAKAVGTVAALVGLGFIIAHFS